MKRVSLVVPARNEEKLLPRCLFALHQQKFDDFEIIVVDSASTDHTQQVARSFGVRVVTLLPHLQIQRSLERLALLS